MSAPIYTQFTERMYANLPEVVREADALNDYALKRYISAIGDVEDQVERLIARFTYLDRQSRLTLDSLADDHSYYGLDYSYFQSSDSRYSAQITSGNNEPLYLRTVQPYRVVPNTMIYVGAVFRTDRQEALNTYGLRLWYYDAGMKLVSTKDVGRNNGSAGPQWVAVNSTDNTPSTAYYVRVSPFCQNTSGASAQVWVDDVYVRSHYEVTTTNNLVSGGHNFTLRSEQELIQQGDFDATQDAQAQADALRAQAQAAYDAAPNIVDNPGFENAYIGWAVTGVTSTTAQFHSGTKSMAVASSGGSITGPAVAVTQGQVWEASGWYLYQGATSPTVTGGLRFQYSVDGTSWVNINSTSNVDVTNNKWQQITTRYTVPLGVQYIRARSAFSAYTGAIWTDDHVLKDITAYSRLTAQADTAQSQANLAAWSRGPSTALVEKALTGVPDIQSYRTWLELGSTSSTEPGYARQGVQSVELSSTYTLSFLALRDATVLSTASVKVTITPNTGGPTVKTFPLEGTEANVPFLLSFTWNSPESVASAIINIEYVTTALPAKGLFINDVSMVRFNSDVSLIGRQGAPSTSSTTEHVGTEMFGGRDIRGTGWIRYETQGDPDTDPMPVGDPDIPSGTSFIESGWHQTQPGNTYTFSGEVFSNNSSNYADLIIWHRNEGKGWGEAMVTRITATSLNGWIRFDRKITIPSSATEFRVNLDVYRADAAKTLNFRNVSMVATENRSWYMSGSRPFAYNALTTKAMNFLSRGDLLHYTANLMATGSSGSGQYGIRVYSNGSQIIHETTIPTTTHDQLIPITGAFQVPESQAELRVALYVNDPTPKHQAAYFLRDLEVVHSTQQFTEDAQNIITNGGFESAPPLDGWALLAEKEQIRRNLVPNSIGTGATTSTNWRVSANDTLALTTVDGAPAIRFTNGVADTTIYTDPNTNYTPPVGTVVHAQVEVKAISPITNMRISNTNYSGAASTSQRRTDITLTPEMGWQTLTIDALITAMPAGGYVRMIIYPSGSNYPVGPLFYFRNMLVEYDTSGAFFDKDTPNTPLATYSWDAATSTHVERALTYSAPVGGANKLTTASGYNKEDVPSRPEGLPLGATSDLVDPLTANTEWLPWLAQFAGKNISHFTTMDNARVALASGNNFSAGTIGAIQNAVQAVLSGTKTVRVFPMTTSLDAIGGATQWDVSIVTRTSESPDIAVMEEAVRLRNAKPAGVVFHFHKHQSTWDAVEIANPTFDIWDTRTWTQLEESGLGD